MTTGFHDPVFATDFLPEDNRLQGCGPMPSAPGPAGTGFYALQLTAFDDDQVAALKLEYAALTAESGGKSGSPAGALPVMQSYEVRKAERDAKPATETA